MHKKSTPQTQVIKQGSGAAHELWDLPDVASPPSEQDEKKTNALGKKAAWKYEPPEEVDVDIPVPLTADEIESIRQAAAEEGFNQGKEEGFAAGYEEGKVKGHEEGIKTGHQEGVAEGLAEGASSIEEQKQAWQQRIEQLHKPLAVVEKNIEEQLLTLVVQLTEAVVGQEIKTNPDILLSAVSTGIKALPSHDAQTQIYLHPNDIRLVEQEFGSEHMQENGWRLLPAPQLEPGSCQIENSTSNIDLRVKSRLKQVLESFLVEAIHQ